MLKKSLIGFAAILVILAVVIALQPSEFRVARSTTIAAAPAVVFAQVNDFHKWEAWSPWAKLDPAAKTSFEGPSAGTGAIFRWAGNEEVGEGSMTITESNPTDRIRIKLDFLKPFATTNLAEFTFRPEGNQTVVTWSMEGTNNFVAKAFCLFINMDKMIGDQFEKGLANMKSVAEGQRSAKRTGELTMTYPAQHVGISINRSADTVYNFVSNPENLPKWAQGLSGSIQNVNGNWVAESPMGRVVVKFADKNALGVLDHEVSLPAGEKFYNPMRVFPNHHGSELIFTVYRRAGISDRQFADDAATVARDLQSLKDLLEKQPT
jgi:uncharacterized protein YndB with AHSA1/START domain